jgi:hypothetical protein
VRVSDTLSLDTMIAPNLLSMAEVRGGSDAIADEMATLKARGWYSSSATPADARGQPRAARLLTSPARICPRGSVPRKDGGPPRGVAEQGHPRKEERTRDKGRLVDSLNNSSGDTEGLGGPDREAFPIDEVKPRLADVCFNACILECLAECLGTTVILMLFDYKYFFHQLVDEMAEIYKMGMAVPA